MVFRLVHKASNTKLSHINTQNTTMASNIAVTDKPKIEEKYHDPEDPSYDPRLDPDVGPYDEDNDFLPDEDMTDEQAAEEAARLERNDRAEAAEAVRLAPTQKDPPVARPRPTKACDGCKKLKKGCDRALPKCGKCTSRGCACVYSRG